MIPTDEIGFVAARAICQRLDVVIELLTSIAAERKLEPTIASIVQERNPTAFTELNQSDVTGYIAAIAMDGRKFWMDNKHSEVEAMRRAIFEVIRLMGLHFGPRGRPPV